MKIKFGQLHATMLCNYSAFAEVANAVLGDGNPSEPERTDITAGAGSFEQALQMVNNALSFN